MKVLICGGRDFTDRDSVARRISELPPESVVISGSAPGADTIAAQEAIAYGFHSAMVPALWARYGKSAGPRRNAAMLSLQPDLVIAFPGGRGTADCIRQAEKLGIPVEEPLAGRVAGGRE